MYAVPTRPDRLTKDSAGHLTCLRPRVVSARLQAGFESVIMTCQCPQKSRSKSTRKQALLASLRGAIRLLEVQELCARARDIDHRTSYALVDLSAANLGLTYDDIESISRFSPLFSNIAIFAPRPIAFGVSRMYQQISVGSGQWISVFANRDEAIKSLNGARRIRRENS